MKNKFLLAGAAALLFASCTKNEIAPKEDALNTNKLSANEVSFGIANDEIGTKSFIDKDADGNFTFNWHAERDYIYVLATNVTNPNAYDPKFGQSWGGEVARNTTGGTLANTHFYTYKATVKGSTGMFTALNDAQMLKFYADGNGDIQKPSFRVFTSLGNVTSYAYANTNTVEYGADGYDLAKEKITLGLAANDKQTQYFSTPVAENIFMVSDPVNDLELQENSQGLLEAVGENLKLRFEKPYAIGVFNVKGLANASTYGFGDLESITITAAENIATTAAGAATIDINNKVDDKWKINIANTATVTNAIKLNIDQDWKDGQYAMIQMLPVAMEGKDYSITYTFENTEVTENHVAKANWNANNYYNFPAFDIAAEPYYLVNCSEQSHTGYMLTVNDPADASRAMSVDAILAEIEVNYDLAKICDFNFLPTRSLTNDEVVALNQLTGIINVLINSESLNLIPSFFVAGTGFINTLETYELPNLAGPANLNLGSTALKSLVIPKVTEVNGRIAGIQLNSIRPEPVTKGVISDNAIIISDELKTIGEGVFQYTTFNTIDLPGVTSIGSKAFKLTPVDDGNTNNATLSLPVITNNNIADDAFGDNQQTDIRGSYNFTEVNMPMYNFDNLYVRNHLLRKSLVKADLSAVTKFYSKDNAISGVKLEGYPKLKELKVGAGATAFEQAFNGCIALATINVEDFISIQRSSFAGTALTSAKINVVPESFSFSGCASLTKVTLGANVKSVDSYTFLGCALLEDINLQGVTTIGAGAFKDCESLKGVYETRRNAYVLSVGATTIGYNAFRGAIAISFIDFTNNVSLSEGSLAFGNQNTAATINFLGDVRFNTPASLNIGTIASNACTLPNTVNFGGNILDENGAYTTAGIISFDYLANPADTDLTSITITAAKVGELN